jgi:hypothetical protein
MRPYAELLGFFAFGFQLDSFVTSQSNAPHWFSQP